MNKLGSDALRALVEDWALDRGLDGVLDGVLGWIEGSDNLRALMKGLALDLGLDGGLDGGLGSLNLGLDGGLDSGLACVLGRGLSCVVHFVLSLQVTACHVFTGAACQP